MNEQPCRQCGQPAGPIGLCRQCYQERRPVPEPPGHAQGNVGNGRFRLLRPLGEGGHGSVWLARDEPASQHGEEKLVALKFLGERTADAPKAMDQLRNEMWLARKLSHPNVVNVFDLHEHAGEPIFYSMEYVPGADLRSYLAASATGRLTGMMIEPWVDQITKGLGYCHGQARVFHRDLKPANIVLTPEGVIRLVDFGIAYADNAGPSGTQRGLTRAYASPQQARGEPASAMDDMYALGATLYHLVTGHLPASNGTETVHPRRLILDSGGSPKDLSPEASETIMRCLSEDSMRRPASVDQFWRWYSRTGPVDEDAPEPEPWPWDRLLDVLRYAMVIGLLAGAGWYLSSMFKDIFRSKPGTNALIPRIVGTSSVDEIKPPPLPQTNAVLEVTVLLPNKVFGRVHVAAVRLDGSAALEPRSLAVDPGTNSVVSQLTLAPGEYWVEAGLGDPKRREGWVRRRVEIAPGPSAVALSLIPQRVDLRLIRKAGLRLFDPWSNRIELRPGDFYTDDKTYRLIESGPNLLLVPGEYVIELDSELQDNWILDDPVLDLRTNVPGPRVIRPRPRLYPRMNATWTASGAADSLLTGHWKFVPVPGFTNVLGSTTEVSIGQFEGFAKDTGLGEPALIPSLTNATTRTWKHPFTNSTDSHPVVGITWQESTNFAGWLTAKCRAGGQLTPRQRFRLPTCAQWTAMAGPGLYPWGDEYPPPTQVANLAGQELTTEEEWPRTWLASPFLLPGRYGGPWTIPVDQLNPVRDLFIGLSGNVAEWCEDDYRPEMNSPELRSSFPRRVQADAVAPGCKVVRGGSWMNGDRTEFLRTSTHWPELPDQRSDRIGFRLVIVEE